MTNNILDDLVSCGTIKSYNYVSVDEDGNVNQHSNARNTERLIIHFNDGQRLIIDTACSGCMENTVLSLSH